MHSPGASPEMASRCLLAVAPLHLLCSQCRGSYLGAAAGLRKPGPLAHESGGGALHGSLPVLLLERPRIPCKSYPPRLDCRCRAPTARLSRPLNRRCAAGRPDAASCSSPWLMCMYGFSSRGDAVSARL